MRRLPHALWGKIRSLGMAWRPLVVLGFLLAGILLVTQGVTWWERVTTISIGVTLFLLFLGFAHLHTWVVTARVAAVLEEDPGPVGRANLPVLRLRVIRTVSLEKPKSFIRSAPPPTTGQLLVFRAAGASPAGLRRGDTLNIEYRQNRMGERRWTWSEGRVVLDLLFRGGPARHEQDGDDEDGDKKAPEIEPLPEGGASYQSKFAPVGRRPIQGKTQHRADGIPDEPITKREFVSSADILDQRRSFRPCGMGNTGKDVFDAIAHENAQSPDKSQGTVECRYHLDQGQICLHVLDERVQERVIEEDGSKHESRSNGQRTVRQQPQQPGEIGQEFGKITHFVHSIPPARLKLEQIYGRMQQLLHLGGI